MAESGYLILKLAGELFHKSPAGLADEERQRVDTVAAKQRQIEQRILTTPEAAGVVLPAAAVEQSLAEIRGRYAEPADFHADLTANGLDEEELRAAIERDQKVEAVLEGVASRAAPVMDTDVEIFYLLHKERFRRPERRTLRHILVTINDSLAGSERAAARRKIEAIHARLAKDKTRFAEQAAKHSECPTAMNGGLLGQVPRGQLFPELEAVAFTLAPGEVSAVAESPLGFHILYCGAVAPEAELPLAEAAERVRRHLTAERRGAAQKAWIAALFKRPG